MSVFKFYFFLLNLYCEPVLSLSKCGRRRVTRNNVFFFIGTAFDTLQHDNFWLRQLYALFIKRKMPA